MKKIIFIPAAAGILAFGGIVLANTDSSVGETPAAQSSNEVSTTPVAAEKQTPKELIGFEKASEIALAIADGKVVDIELSEDDGRQEYEVEIHDAEYDYDFDIDAFSGEVLKQDRERLDDDDKIRSAKTDANVVKQHSKQQNTAEALISVEEATEIALGKTGGGRVEELELEYDDGLRYYDIEIENGKTEFELKINAADGTILKFEQDDDSYDD